MPNETIARFGCSELPAGRNTICSTTKMVISLSHLFGGRLGEYSCSFVGHPWSGDGRFVEITIVERVIALTLLVY